MKDFFFQSISGILGLYLAANLLSGVIFTGPIYILLLAGTTLGLLNVSIKPVLHFFLFPLKLLTFGLIGLVINIGIVWFVTQVLFSDYIQVSGIRSLFLTTVIVWLCSFFFMLLNRSVKQRKKYQY